MDNTSREIADSRFWKRLWATYAASPSIALCRVPELEYAATLPLRGLTLDHCCGDGLFAQIGWPEAKFSAGCDMNETSISAAQRIGRHEQLDVCDAGKKLPYPDQHFDLVFDNSALEHIPDLDGSLGEISRVLRPGGLFAFNVLNHRYFEWWPLDQESMTGYREWQPFYHALSIAQWTERLTAVGLELENLQGYFDEEASRELALLDCEFSGYYIRKRASQLVSKYKSFFSNSKKQWREKLGRLKWQTAPDEGAGYFITARRR
jgi:SAM-dependent methyltransferase